jgi:2-polyprenyl-3-methyl-5-hydroxy-6-metoxy-1,4-benzoquinol methylase/uncharacterized protein YbaR (Trm112 family)
MIKQANSPVQSVPLACPVCGGDLVHGDDGLACERCARGFPVVAGIPDLRLSYPDPYLSWEEDLQAARELAGRFEEYDFPGLLREHWRETGKPAELAERFIAGGLTTMERSRAYLREIEDKRGRPLSEGDRFLEIGCGVAGLGHAAAGRAGSVVASDISMRWLVLAKKRLADAGEAEVALVCCAAEDPPFKPGSFDLVAAGDVIEHVADQRAFLAGAGAVLSPGGTLFLATPNRFSLSLEPHVRLWGVGFLPRRLAKAYVWAVRRAPYDHVRLLSAAQLRRLLTESGFEARIVPPEIPVASQRLYAGLELRLVRLYNRVRLLAQVRRLLLAVGPFFHVFARKLP